MIELRQVNKDFAGTAAVRDFSLTVEEGAFCCLIGPSGCGKTTTLKMINRMIDPTSGAIRIQGRDAREFKPHELRRSMGYVIQSVGLFPHMSVLENICVVPGLLKWDRGRSEARALELLELFGLDPGTFKDKFPRELSGGQAQRIGVARALAADPAVLLMDEPFGALDPISRANLQLQFRTIQSELRKTIVFVTHDIDEAVRLATRVVLMRDGRIVQADTPERMLSVPGAEFVERFIGSERSLKRLSRLLVREAMRSRDRMHPRPGHRPPGGIQELQGSALSGEPAGSGGESLDAPPALDPDTDLRQALALLLQHRRRQMPVRSPDGRLLGELDLLDLLGA